MRSTCPGRASASERADDAADRAERAEAERQPGSPTPRRCRTSSRRPPSGGRRAATSLPRRAATGPTTSVRNGTIMMPPPTPSSPAAPPVRTPKRDERPYSRAPLTRVAHQDRDGAEEDAEDELQRPFVDPRQQARADPRAGDRPDRERERVADAHLAGDAVGDHAREADRDDRAERDRVRVTLRDTPPRGRAAAPSRSRRRPRAAPRARRPRRRSRQSPVEAASVPPTRRPPRVARDRGAIGACDRSDQHSLDPFDEQWIQSRVPRLLPTRAGHPSSQQRHQTRGNRS